MIDLGGVLAGDALRIIGILSASGVRQGEKQILIAHKNLHIWENQG